MKELIHAIAEGNDCYDFEEYLSTIATTIELESFKQPAKTCTGARILYLGLDLIVVIVRSEFKNPHNEGFSPQFYVK